MSDSSNLRGKLLNFFESFGKVVAGITFAATIISLLGNFIIFSSWGLSFSLIASPSDILIGGLEAITILLPLLFAISIGYFAGRFISRRVGKALKGPKLYFTITLLILAYCIPLWLTTPLDYLPYVRISSGFLPFFVMYPILITGLAIGLLMDSIVIDIFIKALVILFLLYMFIDYLSFTAKTRYAELVAIGGSANHCPKSEHVVWVGSSLLVTSCSRPPYQEDGEYFVFERSGVTLSVRPRKVTANNAQTH